VWLPNPDGVLKAVPPHMTLMADLLGPEFS